MNIYAVDPDCVANKEVARKVWLKPEGLVASIYPPYKREGLEDE